MRRFGFLLIDGHALLSTAAALEPLRAADLLSGRSLYDVLILSPHAEITRSSAGSMFDAVPIARASLDFDVVFVVAGGDPLAFDDPKTLAWLRRLDRAGVALGGISGGAAILAAAGLLTDRRFTIHWHHHEALRARWPKLLVERRLYVIDRDRYTCAGGAAPLDMMHHVIARDHGAAFARKIADWFIQTQVRTADTRQASKLDPPTAPLTATVRKVVDLMETHLVDALDLDDLAELSGVSRRQLQRLFHEAFGRPVMAVYRGIRLEAARNLLAETDTRVGEIAQMTGFTTQAHFADAYRRAFGEAPTALRRRPRATR